VARNPIAPRLLWLAAGGLVALTAACGGQPAAASAVVRPSASAPPTTSSSTAPARPRPAPVAARWPLTGLPRGAGQAVGPAVSIKVDNVQFARPQAGLNQADVVFEVLVEGGLSRFLAVYNSTPAASVGPIRSARPVDGALLRALHGGIFGYSGAAYGEIAPAKAYSTALLISNDGDPGAFHRDGSRGAPSNVFTSTGTLLDEASRLGGPKGPAPALFGFGPLDAAATPASSAAVHIGAFADAHWAWNGQRWLRSEDGSAHLLTDGSQVSADNVLMLRVQVTHSGIIDAAGNEDPFVLAYGSGSVVLLRGGHQVTGHWSRPSIEAAYRFTDDRGAPLALAPGRTWVELIPPGGSTTVS
jgi:hypothetical protein